MESGSSSWKDSLWLKNESQGWGALGVIGSAAASPANFKPTWQVPGQVHLQAIEGSYKETVLHLHVKSDLSIDEMDFQGAASFPVLRSDQALNEHITGFVEGILAVGGLLG